MDDLWNALVDITNDLDIPLHDDPDVSFPIRRSEEVIVDGRKYAIDLSINLKETE